MEQCQYKQYIKGMQHIGIPSTLAKFDETVAFYQMLGFEIAREEHLPGLRMAFLTIPNVMIEIYESKETPCKAGSVDHIALGAEHVEELYEAMKDQYTVVSDGLESLPAFDNGVRYFKILGPNSETVEFFEIL